MSDQPAPAKKRTSPQRLTGTHPQRAPHNPAGGRPGEGVKLTPEIADTICAALRIGAHMRLAASYAGVPNSTFGLWMKQGRNGIAPYDKFIEQVDLAVADGKLRDLTRIDKAADTDWRAGAWKLERSFPSEFGQKTQSEVTIQARPFVDVAKLTLEEQQTLLALLQKGAPDADEVPKDGRAALELLPGDSAAA